MSTAVNPTGQSGDTLGRTLLQRIAECDTCGRDYICSYHEGWGDAEDALTPLVAQQPGQTGAGAGLQTRVAQALCGWREPCESCRDKAAAVIPLVAQAQRDADVGIVQGFVRASDAADALRTRLLITEDSA